ncbi:MAG: Tn3 family transposase [Symploca sp. SIO1C4]|uniref:Tn3 family transposase n=1 Tax=Symploca sp. SIO1C4 TaxID=2607765 RepID=A0A6B3NDJ1_9CYAN|nr:Tn3 family transposase [Symploca sp. SIO1C4]
MKLSWQPEELVEHWTLLPNELALLARKTDPNRLGFALLFKFFQYTARFPTTSSEIPQAIIDYVARQLIILPSFFNEYDWQGRTISTHRAQIREYFGFREATVTDASELTIWLETQALTYEFNAESLKEASLEYLRTRKIEPPTMGRLSRLIRSALRRNEEHLYHSTLQQLSKQVRGRLDHLLSDEELSVSLSNGGEKAFSKETYSLLAQLKTDPGRLGLESLQLEAAKLQQLRQLELPEQLFAGVSSKILHIYKQRVAVEAPSQLRRHPQPRRYTMIAAFCWLRIQEITDNLVELLIQIVHRLGARAQRRVEKELLNDFKQVSGKTSLLFRLAEAAISQPDGTVREVLYPIVGEQTLKNLVREFKSTGTAYREKVYTVMRSSYGNHYRRMIPLILNLLEFRSNNELHKPVIEALELLKKYTDSKQRYYDQSEKVPLEGIVPSGWREIIVEESSENQLKINRINYELAVLQSLRDGLRCKEIWVVGANRYRNPEQDLPTDFEEHREVYYQALKQPTKPEEFIAKLQQQMTEALTSVDQGMPKNAAVRLLKKNNGWIRLSPFSPSREPASLEHLKREIERRWPMTGLLDMLKETDLRVNFTQHFKSVATRENLDPQILQKRLLSCLYALGTNTGIRRLSLEELDIPYADLLYVRRRFLHKPQLRNAIAEVVNATLKARQPQIWGEGTTSCASDSKKFGAWDQNLMTEWHIRYGGRGVMIYWHVEKNSACIYSQLKTCSSSEVAAMIEGVLRHCTTMKVEKNFVDSHGQSEVAFAFCHLLGFELMPRLKGIHRQKLYRCSSGQPEAYSNLQLILTRPINWELIAQQYDQMIKYTTALRLGTAETEAILKRFTRTNIKHPTYRAFAELGKVIKTIFLCQYLNSEALRREINEALNVVESWNNANGFIFFGKGKEIATNRLEDQEIAVLSLHLLQSCLVYINTLMIQQVLSDSEWIELMEPEDLRGLTPLIWSHVNPYGVFRLNLSERLPIEVAA